MKTFYSKSHKNEQKYLTCNINIQDDIGGKTVKKSRKKERPKEDSNHPKPDSKNAEKDRRDRLEVNKIPIITELSSHKTFSTPVDPVELKKRLSAMG